MMMVKVSWRLWLTVLLAALVAVLSACGSSDSNGGAATAASDGEDVERSESETTASSEDVAANIAKFEEPVEFVPPGPAFDGAGSLEDKRIYVVANGLNYDYVQNLVAGIEEAVELLGGSVTVGDAGGDPSKAASLVEQATGQGYDAIVTQSIPSEVIAEPLRSASQAGLSIIEMFAGDPAPLTAEQKEIGVSAAVSNCYGCGAELMAEAAFAEDGDNVNAVVFSTPEIGVGKREGERFVSRLKEICGDCEARIVDAPLASWGSDLTNSASSALRRDPDVNYLVPVFDAMVQFVEPAIASSGRDVKIVTYNATKGGLEDVKSGAVAANPGAMQTWLGWAAADQLARIETGTPVVDDSNVPNRLFTHRNIDEVDLEQPEPSWYGSIDLRKEFSEVWGIE